MELEEMRSAWTEMSTVVEKQKKLTDKLIIDMTQAKYQNTLSRIKTPELISTAICALQVMLILVNFRKFDTGFSVACAIISVAILSILPILSIRAINKMNNLNVTNNNYKQILTDYANDKLRFLSIQRLSFFLGFILMITCLPVMLKIMDGKNKEVSPEVWFWFLPLGMLFFIIFARWVYGYYARTATRAENLLKELNDTEPQKKSI